MTASVTGRKLVALSLTSAIMSLSNAYATPTDTTTNNAAVTGSTTPGPITLDTDNGSVRIQITQDPKTIQLKEPVKFILDFLDPSSNKSISHVNYDFSVVDEQQNKIADKSSMHTHKGHDTQSVVFDNPGNFTLSINVKGTGIDKPFDTSQSGMVTTHIVV